MANLQTICNLIGQKNTILAIFYSLLQYCTFRQKKNKKNKTKKRSISVAEKKLKRIN